MTSAHARYDVRIFQKECTSLAEAGFQVYLIVDDEMEDEVKNNVRIKSTFHRSKNRIDRMFNSAMKVYKKALAVNAEIYHIHDPELLPFGYFLKRKGKKVIFDSHEFTAKQIEFKDYLPLFLRKPIAFFYRVYEKWVVGKLDAVITPCTFAAKKYFADQGVTEVLINNLPKIEDVNIAKSLTEKKKQQACYVGALTEKRGIIEIVKASEKAEIPLILAGEFSTRDLKNMILSNKNLFVEYVGVLDRIQVRKLLSQSIIGLSVLKDVGQYKYLDNLPTKVYEYMGAGLPVVVSDFPYYKKVVEDLECGICVNPNQIENIVDSMKWLLEHPDEAEKMGKRGQKAVMEKFNWSLEEQKLILLYKELLGKNI